MKIVYHNMEGPQGSGSEGAGGGDDDDGVGGSQHKAAAPPAARASLKRAAEGPAGDELGSPEAGQEAQPESSSAGVRKRNRRMFGALLGTLQKFREEDAQFQSSSVASKRAEALRKAEERERATSQQLRRKEADKRAAERNEELARLSDLTLATDIKLLEVIYAKRIARKDTLSGFLVTKAHPPLYWSPATPSDATSTLAAQQAEDLLQWKASVAAELDAEKAALTERAMARREAALARRAEREARINAARAAAGSAGPVAAAAAAAAEDAEKAEQEREEREMQAGEYAGHEEVAAARAAAAAQAGGASQAGEQGQLGHR
ncbi:Pinin_SDK_memA domain-containing protein [Haematococcus lacustris]|uniref:Pinin_SDK_memA domain-containing protein n=1 Tax=Haematococcus lacustris TaxID=44745 RepID=A0A699YS04_HAELA|nr:Pinin_SDK_memA domain-containing protein [Haematococcus lacustris]